MVVIPAIDIKDGKVVRLLQGRYTEPIVYSHDPVETARGWQKEGARRLHVVDLDGALAGEIRNSFLLAQIIADVNIPVQFGGGLRNREDIASIINVIGAKWAVLGTAACEDLDFIKEIISEFAEQIIISIDAKYRKVAARGWTKITEIEDVELIKKLQDIGVKSFIYTDISRDGTLAGPDIEAIQRVLKETSACLFYSGGISSLQDVNNLKSLEREGLAGVIIGKALYENKIHLLQIKKVLEEGI